MNEKKMADIFFGKFSKLISKDEIESKNETEVNDESYNNQISKNKKPNQKIFIYSAVIIAAVILIFLVF